MRIVLPLLVLAACNPEYGVQGNADTPEIADRNGVDGDKDDGDHVYDPDRNDDPTGNDGDDPDDDREFDPPTPDDDGEREYDPDGPGSDEDLCRTQGFWRNHSGLWPVSSIVIGDQLYSHGEAEALMDLPSWGDSSLILVQQLVAAELNVLVGAPAGIQDVIDDAHDWMAANDDGAGLPFGIDTSSAAGSEAVVLSQQLDAYNNQNCAQ